MDAYVRTNNGKVETKSEVAKRKGEKRPAIIFGSENLNPVKKSRRSEERPPSYIHESRWIRERYENLTLIGKGSFGMVYRAKPKDASRKYVAIKEILRHTTSKNDDRRHAVCEINLVQKLGGQKNILKTMEVYQDMGAYIVMEYFPHDEFRDIVKDMSSTEIIMYMKNLVTSLQYLHSHNIIHRDCKPDNFLYNRKHRRYALIDFGLAQYYSNNIDKSAELKKKFGTSMNTSRRSGLDLPCLCEGKLAPPCSMCQLKPTFVVNKAGTPRFLAPEILIGSAKQTTKMDMWAAGKMLFYLLIKKYPFFHAKDNLAMISELSSVFGTQPFVETANEQGMKLSLNFSFRSLNIVQFAFSHRYEFIKTSLSLPLSCSYCKEYFQARLNPEKLADLGCFCCPLDINESCQLLLQDNDKELAQMLFHCLQVDPNQRISSEDFVNKFPLNQ